MTGLRIGQGYDVHRLEAGRKLILGGVAVPYEKGLLGHSDADVLLHALMDALLGAAGLGDIGSHFPDTDPQYAGASSLLLLIRVGQKLRDAGYVLVNADVTLLAQAPKIVPYRQAMAENIAVALGVELDQINVKATTEEGLGFTGDGSGMAAHAIVLVEKKK
ncbi:2-C-methyl-D-erythritol 2,4-cyclodiphosphate synthase [Oscillibacter sp. MSJ-2]|uniref:2-C-methyl-D-erythritol 2,4-cyclodiphosphate synthase n=1 Tax=Dysosmobacter acutus TaxID=2841504 RepID=A0ABS6FAU0_9FIRM|nr:2-C-methyl-D-erythritol 2,4-cyclodiphosphate synthase [Dysosmobacter acutus]